MRAFGSAVLLVMLLAACERASVRAPLVSKIPRELQLSVQDSVRGRLPRGGLLMWLDAEKRFRKLNAPEQCRDVFRGVRYADGIEIPAVSPTQKAAA